MLGEHSRGSYSPPRLSGEKSEEKLSHWEDTVRDFSTPSNLIGLDLF